MDRSLRFGSRWCNSIALFGLAFATATALALTLLHHANSQAHGADIDRIEEAVAGRVGDDGEGQMAVGRVEVLGAGGFLRGVFEACSRRPPCRRRRTARRRRSRQAKAPRRMPRASVNVSLTYLPLVVRERTQFRACLTHVSERSLPKSYFSPREGPRVNREFDRRSEKIDFGPGSSAQRMNRST